MVVAVHTNNQYGFLFFTYLNHDMFIIFHIQKCNVKVVLKMEVEGM